MELLVKKIKLESKKATQKLKKVKVLEKKFNKQKISPFALQSKFVPIKSFSSQLKSQGKFFFFALAQGILYKGGDLPTCSTERISSWIVIFICKT